MKTIVTRLSFCLLMFVLTGCASIAQHSGKTFVGETPARYVYAGTESDIQGMRGKKDTDLYDVMFGGIGVVVAFFDMPLSFAVDTVLLPFDACIMGIGGKTRQGADRHPKPPAEPKTPP